MSGAARVAGDHAGAGDHGGAGDTAAGPGDARVRGRLYAGTSGFAYPSWIPLFYAPGRASRKLLAAYAARLPAVELHSTFYRRPAADVVASWLAQTPAHFRFCPKAQRGVSWRALRGAPPDAGSGAPPDAGSGAPGEDLPRTRADSAARTPSVTERGTPADPRRINAADSMAWLGESLRAFGDRLGCVLLSALGSMERDDDALTHLLAVRPPDLPLALELPHPSWAADEVYGILAAHGVSLVATDWDDGEEPDLRRIGSFLYLRLRRTSYSDADLARWAQRLEPFLADGLDAYVFLRHDEDGTNALRAEALLKISESTDP